MPYRVAFWIKGLPPTLNGRFSPAMKWKSNLEWYEKVKAELVGKLPPAPLKRARITLTRHSGARRPDFDNLVSGFKPVLDALKKHGVISDDRSDEIGIPEYLWAKASPGKSHITVVVEEI